ncbi:hypothetical protein DRN94_003545 [archaeon]|nr:hypothetical protein [archaeon]
MEKGEVRTVLKWVRDLLAWASQDITRVDTAIVELEKNRDVVVEAFKNACVDEVRDYVETVAGFIVGRKD